MATSPSVIQRDALRSAIRNHPAQRSVLAGRLVSVLSKADLIETVRALGLDPDAIMAGAVGQPAPADQGDQDASDQGDQDKASDQGDQDTAAIESEVTAVRGQITSRGFGALDEIIRKLVTDARKPAVTVTVEVPVASGTTGGAPVTHARPTGQDATWSKLFGVRGALGARTTKLWDGAHPDTPKVNSRYVWPQPTTAIALTQIARGRNVLLYGPAGTGKTEWAQQLAARTGRPFALISCDSATDGPTLVGMTVPSPDGVAWQDGQLTRAIQTPGCVVCLDEPSIARPGALFAMQNVLANRTLFITETGARVRVADGVVFVATDNTNGTGGGGRRGYTDTNRLNAAFLDRFGVRVRFDFMPADKESAIIQSYVSGCTRELAELLVTVAKVTRANADNQVITAGIGLRRLLSWAELLVDGIDAEDAFAPDILNCAPEQDVEALRQQCLLAYDKANVERALNPVPATDTVDVSAPSDPAHTNPTMAGRMAAADFRS